MDSSAELGVGILGLLMILIVAVIGLALFAFWIWMLIHAITNKGLRDLEKLIWVLVILFTHFIGALIYFFIGKPKGASSLPHLAT
jgi:uncharacterized membrane protein YhaH (DUF805 family)